MTVDRTLLIKEITVCAILAYFAKNIGQQGRCHCAPLFSGCTHDLIFDANLDQAICALSVNSLNERMDPFAFYREG